MNDSLTPKAVVAEMDAPSSDKRRQRAVAVRFATVAAAALPSSRRGGVTPKIS